MNNEKKGISNDSDAIIREQIIKEGQRLEGILGQEPAPEIPEMSVAEQEEMLSNILAKAKERSAQMEGKQSITKISHTKKSDTTRNMDEKTDGVRQKPSRKLPTIMKWVAAVVVLCGSIFGLSMTSQAGRMWWMESVQRILGQETNVVIDNDDDRVESDLSDAEAAEVIERETGMSVPEFFYLPENTFFLDYEYDVNSTIASVYFQNIETEQILQLEITGSNMNRTGDFVRDGAILTQKEVECRFGQVVISEYATETDRVSAIVAQWSFENCTYRISGKLSLDEMENIVTGMIY